MIYSYISNYCFFEINEPLENAPKCYYKKYYEQQNSCLCSALLLSFAAQVNCVASGHLYIVNSESFASSVKRHICNIKIHEISDFAISREFYYAKFRGKKSLAKIFKLTVLNPSHLVLGDQIRLWTIAVISEKQWVVCISEEQGPNVYSRGTWGNYV